VIRKAVWVGRGSRGCDWAGDKDEGEDSEVGKEGVSEEDGEDEEETGEDEEEYGEHAEDAGGVVEEK
jgi:hypothetical protein